MATISDCIQHSWKNLFNYRDRASRKELLVFLLAYFLFALCAIAFFSIAFYTFLKIKLSLENQVITPIIATSLLTLNSFETAMYIPVFFSVVFFFYLIPANYCILMRRLNDYGYRRTMFIPYLMLEAFLKTFFWGLPLAVLGYTKSEQLMTPGSSILYLLYVIVAYLILTYLLWFRLGTNGKNQHGDAPIC